MFDSTIWAKAEEKKRMTVAEMTGNIIMDFFAVSGLRYQHVTSRCKMFLDDLHSS